MDKMARVGVKVVDLFDPVSFRQKLRIIVKEKNFFLKNYYGRPMVSADKIADQYLKLGSIIKPLIQDTTVYLESALKKGHAVLAEGAQGTLLDVDFGTYPYVTSSSASVGGVCTGLGVGPRWWDEIYGVAKAYATRVGEGPFTSEMDEVFGEKIRQRGGEFGATTGRPRRCGWMDLVALKYACRVNGFTGILLTKIDVLSNLPTLKICTSYQIEGKKVSEFPAGLNTLSKAKPVYREMKGWQGDLAHAESIKDLPVEARRYIDEIEKYIQVPIQWVSVGPDRSQIFPRS
jgi:adenylosuccinate synthase